MKRIALARAAATCFSLCSAHEANAAAGLCERQETAYFSCSAPGARLISVCGDGSHALQYRFGRRGAVELTYPSSPAEGPRAIWFGHYNRFQTERVELRFETGGAEYVVFDYLEGAHRQAGVRVVIAGAEREVRCTRAVKSRLLELKSVLPCDPDSALNGGSCP